MTKLSLNDTKAVSAASKLRRIAASSSVTFAIDEAVMNDWKEAAYNATEVVPILLLNLHPTHVLDVSDDGSQYIIEGPFGRLLSVECVDDLVEVHKAESEMSEVKECERVLLFPDSLFEINGIYQVSLVIGRTVHNFNIKGEQVEGGCISVNPKTFETEVSNFISRRTRRLPVSIYHVNGDLNALHGHYEEYEDKVFDQISVMVGGLVNGKLTNDVIMQLVQYLDGRLREAKRIGIYNKIIEKLKSSYPEERVLIGLE
jgi:hypothetical protein